MDFDTPLNAISRGSRFLLILLLSVLPPGSLIPEENLYSKPPPTPTLAPLFRLPTGGRIVGPVLEDSAGRLLLTSEDRYLYRLGRDGSIQRRDDVRGFPAGFASLGIDDTLYTVLRGRVLAAINRGGRELWRLRLADLPAADPVIGSSGELFLVSDTGRLLALDHRGELLWEEELSGGYGGQPLIDGRGVLIVPDGAGFLTAWLPWGRPLWRFRLAGPMSALAAGEELLYAASSEGTVAAISADGTLRWSRYLGTELAFLVEDGELVAGLSYAGNGVLLEHGGILRHSWKLPLGHATGLFAVDGGFLAVGGQGKILLVDREGQSVATKQLGGPLDRPSLLSGGILAGGGADWNLHTATTPLLMRKSWSAPGGDPGNRWNRQLIAGSASPDGSEGNPDYLLLSALLARDERLTRVEALAILESKLSLSRGRERRYPPFYRSLTIRIATEAVDRPMIREGRVMNDFPELRRQAIDLLAEEASYASRGALQQVVEQDWSADCRIAALRGLGRIGSDVDGSSTRIIAGVLLSDQLAGRQTDLVRAGLETLGAILEYHGSAPDRRLYEASLEVYRHSQDRETRRRALKILRYQP